MSDWQRVEAVVARDAAGLSREEQGKLAVELVQRATARGLSVRALLFLLEHGYTVEEVLARIAAVEALPRITGDHLPQQTALPPGEGSR